MKLLGILLQMAERLPLERILLKPPDNKKHIQELREILESGRAAPAEAPAEAPLEYPAEPIPPEYEDMKGFLTPRESKVHVQPPSTGGSSTEETVVYQNREIGKLLLRMERHYAQKLRINGIPCDCGAQKHLLDLESLCEETVPMVDDSSVYYAIIKWAKAVAPKSTDIAAKSGQYDDEYPRFSGQARDFRKIVMGSSEPAALFGKKAEQSPDETTELPATDTPAPESEPDQHGKCELKNGTLIYRVPAGEDEPPLRTHTD